MLLPGARLIETAETMHVFTGRSLTSIEVTDAAARGALRRACAEVPHPPGPVPGGGPDEDAVADAHDLLVELGVATRRPSPFRRSDTGAEYTATVHFGPPDLDAVAARLARTTVYVLSDDADALLGGLHQSGLTCRTLTDARDIAGLDASTSVVVVTDRDERPGRRLLAANTAALSTGVPWLPVSVYDGAVVNLGPLILPGATACYECTRRRLASNTAYTALYDDVVAVAPAAPTPRALRTWAHSLATLMLLHWVGNQDEQLPGLMLTLDPAVLQVRRSRVYRVPRCPSCASPDYAVAAAPWEPVRDH